MRVDRDRLLDILESIENIRKYAEKGQAVFLGDELVQVWIIHHIQVIGEAAANLSQAFRESHTELPWPDIVSMRNVVVHHYFGIDLNQIWDTVNIDLPKLESAIQEILQKMGE